MKTVIICYMPGHAGHFISRLFALSKETMPLITQDRLDKHLSLGTALQEDVDRLTYYSFSRIKNVSESWLQFHYAEAAFLELPQYRLLNVFCEFRYSRIVMPVHPCEIVTHSVLIKDCEFYYVDLDLDQWGGWVTDQQEKIKFCTRAGEHIQFEQCKKQYKMNPISLTKLLESETSFTQEYLAICDQMMIDPLLDQALWLRQDWYSLRVQEYAQCM